MLTIEATEYLLSSPINRERLLQSVKNIDNRKNLIVTDLTELKALKNKANAYPKSLWGKL